MIRGHPCLDCSKQRLRVKVHGVFYCISGFSVTLACARFSGHYWTAVSLYYWERPNSLGKAKPKTPDTGRQKQLWFDSKLFSRSHSPLARCCVCVCDQVACAVEPSSGIVAC